MDELVGDVDVAEVSIVASEWLIMSKLLMMGSMLKKCSLLLSELLMVNKLLQNYLRPSKVCQSVF
jgi:hypothetical protein